MDRGLNSREGHASAHRLRAILRAGREQRFTRREQLGVVLISHVVILVSVLLIMATLMDATPPRLFWIGEALIIAVCGVLTFEAPVIKQVIRRMLGLSPEGGGGRGAWDRESAARYVLIFAYGLQFAALWPLLTSTGGAITSPFGQMAVAFAIFAPFIANNWITSLSVLVTTIAYYAALVVKCGLAGGTIDASAWAYFFVNVMILVLAVVVTLADLRAREVHLIQHGDFEEPSPT